MDSISIPSVLDLNIKGPAHCTTRREDDALAFYPAGPGGATEPVRVQPRPAEWRAFRAKLDDLDAWSWQNDFGAGVMGGSPWTLRVEWDGQSIRCQGNLAPGHSPSGFKQFLGGLAALIGTPNKLMHLAADDPLRSLLRSLERPSL